MESGHRSGRGSAAPPYALGRVGTACQPSCSAKVKQSSEYRVQITESGHR